MRAKYQKRCLLNYLDSNIDSEAGYGLLQSGLSDGVGAALAVLLLICSAILIARLLMACAIELLQCIG